MSLWSAAEVRANASEADAILVGAVEPMDAAALAELARCRILVRRGVGVDNVDVAAATDLGLPVAYVPDASVEEVSDHALALLLALERRVSALDRAVRQGAWTRDATTLAPHRRGMRRLSTLTLGIAGIGRIGAALARKARPIFGALLAYDPYATEHAAAAVGAALVPFDDLLARADAISIHAPHTPETHHLFDERAFARMRAGAYLVNTSRGGLVDEAALAAALGAGRLAGAGLDVTEQEPLAPDSPLLRMESVLFTAHSAAMSESADLDLRRRAVEAAVAALQGRRPAALANPEVLSRPNCRLALAAERSAATGDRR